MMELTIRWLPVEDGGPLRVHLEWNGHTAVLSSQDYARLANMVGRSVLGCLDDEAEDEKKS